MFGFFSSKKKSPSTPPETGNAPIPSSEGDDFIFIERKSNVKPNLGDDSGPGPNPLYPPLLPYTLGHATPGSPTVHVNQLNRQDSMATSPNILQGIPFKLSPKLDSDSSDHLREYTERANDVLFQISQLNIEGCDYDFTVENSVLREVVGEFD